MRMSNTTSNAVATMFIFAFVLVCITMLEIERLLQNGVYQYDTEVRQLLIRASLVFILSWTVVVASAVILCG